MDHAVFADMNARELEKLLSGKKTTIIRGAALRPAGDLVLPGDIVYFARDLGKAVVVARGIVKDSHLTKPGEKETAALLSAFSESLDLSKTEAKSWAKRKHVLLVELRSVKEVSPFAVEFIKTKANNLRPVGYINKIRAG